jgi:hypothetical protein
VQIPNPKGVLRLTAAFAASAAPVPPPTSRRSPDRRRRRGAGTGDTRPRRFRRTTDSIRRPRFRQPKARWTCGQPRQRTRHAAMRTTSAQDHGFADGLVLRLVSLWIVAQQELLESASHCSQRREGINDGTMSFPCPPAPARPIEIAFNLSSAASPPAGLPRASRWRCYAGVRGRSCITPASGTCTHAGRLFNSYASSYNALSST